MHDQDFDDRFAAFRAGGPLVVPAGPGAARAVHRHRRRVHAVTGGALVALLVAGAPVAVTAIDQRPDRPNVTTTGHPTPSIDAPARHPRRTRPGSGARADRFDHSGDGGPEGADVGAGRRDAPGVRRPRVRALQPRARGRRNVRGHLPFSVPTAYRTCSVSGHRRPQGLLHRWKHQLGRDRRALPIRGPTRDGSSTGSVRSSHTATPATGSNRRSRRRDSPATSR